MMPDTPLHAKVNWTVAGLAVTVFLAVFAGIWAARGYVGDVGTASRDVLVLQSDMRSVDGRLRELTANDAAQRARLDVLEARNAMALERATQPNLPPPYQAPLLAQGSRR